MGKMSSISWKLEQEIHDLLSFNFEIEDIRTNNRWDRAKVETIEFEVDIFRVIEDSDDILEWREFHWEEIRRKILIKNKELRDKYGVVINTYDSGYDIFETYITLYLVFTVAQD